MKPKILVLLPFICLSVCLDLTSQEAKRRWKKMNQIRKDKFDLVLPEAMRENQIDMWIITNREGNYDPLYPDMGGGYTSGNAYYVFTDPGSGRVERAVLGMFGYLIEQTDAYDYYGSASELRSYILERDPEKIGLNMSKDIVDSPTKDAVKFFNGPFLESSSQVML